MHHQPDQETRYRRLGATAAATLLVAAMLGTAAPASAAAPGGASPGHGDRDRVLLFIASERSQPGVTAAGVVAIGKVARSERFDLDVTGDAGRFTAINLDRYAVVVFLNTVGDNLDGAQQAAFEAYLRGGGGFLGIHSAIEAEPEWQFMSDLLGTRAAGLTDRQRATVEVADQVHPASDVLPERWQVTDHWYNFTGSVRGVSHVLATVDETTFDGGSMGFDHPISWCTDFQDGRSFYTGRGGTVGSYFESRFRRHLGGAIEWAAGRGDGDCGATVQANYQMTVIATQPDVGEPMAIAVLPDGRVLQTTRTGQVRLHQGDGSGTQVIAEIPVYSHSEDGLYGPVLDPDFEDNGWVYLYYAPPLATPPGNAPETSPDPSVWEPFEGYFQLSRFRFVDGSEPSLDLASEQQILRVPVDRGACCHVGGDLVFDSRGNLLLTTGDDTNPFASNGYAPLDDVAPPEAEEFRSPVFDGRRSAGNTNDLRGKVLRIRVQPDGSYRIPHGNLFPEWRDRDDQTRPEIYAMGLRNPFRINIDHRDRIYLTDYSPDARNPDPARGPEGTGRMMIIDEPGNYGWPYCAQPDLPYVEFDFATEQSGEPFDCDGPVNESRHNTGRSTLPPVEESLLWYTFTATTPCPEAYLADPPQECAFRFPELGTGGVGPHGAVPYEFDRRLDSPTKFPEYFDGAIFFSEFTRDFQKEIRLDRHGDILAINPSLDCGDMNGWPDEHPFLCDDPMDVMFGPDGNFYILNYGDGFFEANPDASLVKFSYVKPGSQP